MVIAPAPSRLCRWPAWMVLLLGLCAGPSAAARSALDNLRFSAIGQDQGLPQNTLQRMVQDAQGFLWIAAQEGLIRYDGYQFIAFAHDAQDPLSLSQNTVRDLVNAGDNMLWVATHGGGLNRFHIAEQTFEAWRNDPVDPRSISEDSLTCLYVDGDGVLWVGTETMGICRFDGDGFTRFLPEQGPDSLRAGRIRAMADAGDGKLWAATSGGLALLDKTTGSCSHIATSEAGLADNNVTALMRDPQGRLWVGNQGLIQSYDAATDSWRRYAPEGRPMGRVNYFFTRGDTLWVAGDTGLYLLEPGDTVLRQVQRATVPGMERMIVTSIFEDRNGCLWFTSLGSGLLRAAPERLHFNTWTSEPGNPDSLSSFLVTSILEDKRGRLWVATLDGGLNMRPTPGRPFQHLRDMQDGGMDETSIFGLYESADGTLWVSTENGLYRGSPGAEGVQFQNMRPQMDGHSDTTMVRGDPSGDIWVGTYSRGLLHLDVAAGHIKAQYENDPQDKQSLSHNLVISLYISDDGIAWVGTYDGLNRLDPATGVIRRYGDSADHDGLTNQLITSICHKDARLWLGTNGGGINVFDPRVSRVTTTYGEAEGLPGNYIMGVVEDHLGMLWISTTKGLARLDAGTGAVRVYDEQDGLLTDEFVSCAYFFSASKEMYFGSIRGLVSFKPEEVQPTPEPPAVALTRFLTNNEPVDLQRLDAASPLERAIARTETLTLNHDQKMFSIEYSALDFNRPEKNRYAYRLRGFNDTWTNADAKRRFATYTNLDPGNYTLQVKAANPDGIWSDSYRELHLRIKPHPLFSTPAKMLYGLIIALVVLAYVRLQRIALKNAQTVARRDRELARQERRHKERLELEVAERTAELVETQKRLLTQEKLASLGTLTAGVAHEIRNPLNFVTNFAEVINGYIEEMDDLLKTGRRTEADEREARELLTDMAESARGIMRHGRRAEEIVVNMLGFAQGRTTRFQPSDLNALVREYANLSFQSARNRGNLPTPDLHFALDDDVGLVPVEPQSISRVILNLVNNAIEAGADRAPEDTRRPEIWISTRKCDDDVVVKVRDNGCGIPADKIAGIFRPFYTTKEEGVNVGLGLAISYDIVEGRHGGKLQVESEPGSFTEVRFILPAVRDLSEPAPALVDESSWTDA